MIRWTAFGLGMMLGSASALMTASMWAPDRFDGVLQLSARVEPELVLPTKYDVFVRTVEASQRQVMADAQ